MSLDFSAPPPARPSRPVPQAFPHGIPPGETAFSHLYALAHAGLRAKYQPGHAAGRQAARPRVGRDRGGRPGRLLPDRLGYRAGGAARGIRCQGRGSAANSLVAYVLGITPVDPLAHHLLFERFLSDRTDTMPDIDLDFERDRRDEVIAYVYERYGREHTALVCNVVTYQPRLAVRDAARALGFPPEELESRERGSLGAPGSQLVAPAPPTDADNLALLTDLAAQLIGVRATSPFTPAACWSRRNRWWRSCRWNTRPSRGSSWRSGTKTALRMPA